jgi:hypothetical protein
MERQQEAVRHLSWAQSAEAVLLQSERQPLREDPVASAEGVAARLVYEISRHQF